ncbi:hypothetical protein EVC45_42685, partial [Paraburkholderia sp. UYCP14C]|uniref:ATP-dependent metallopeptidase FtsH/Yme1/Tma family protein n=1 Tax=Paraburkholderia sp. UYCP14C TaxID=2511130 RepID=UPI0010D7B9F3
MKEDRVEWRPHRRKPSPWLDMTSAAEMLFVGIVFALRLLASQVTTIDVAYSDFLQLVEARQVQDLVVTPTRITGTLKMPGTKRGTRSSHTTASTAIQRIGLATLGEPADPMGLPGFEPWRGA